jgi:hypothetical protein
MTSAQTKLYWKAWAAVARVHNWRGSGEALASTHQACWVSPSLDRTYQSVWSMASGLAWQEGRSSISADDLRHACAAVALGRVTSSKRLSNADFDRALALFRLLAEPENLAHLEAWENRDAGERRRHAHVITQTPPAYWQRISRDKFGPADLDRLSLEQLRQLSLTLRLRPAARPQPKADATLPPAQLCPA